MLVWHAFDLVDIANCCQSCHLSLPFWELRRSKAKYLQHLLSALRIFVSCLQWQQRQVCPREFRSRRKGWWRLQLIKFLKSRTQFVLTGTGSGHRRLCHRQSPILSGFVPKLAAPLKNNSQPRLRCTVVNIRQSANILARCVAARFLNLPTASRDIHYCFQVVVEGPMQSPFQGASRRLPKPAAFF